MLQITVAVVEPGDDDDGDETLDFVVVARATCPYSTDLGLPCTRHRLGLITQDLLLILHPDV